MKRKDKVSKARKSCAYSKTEEKKEVVLYVRRVVLEGVSWLLKSDQKGPTKKKKRSYRSL